MNQPKIKLRSFIPEDRERILDILTNDRVNRTYMLPDYEKREDALPLFQRLTELSHHPGRFVRCITREEDAIGFLNDVEIKDGRIELGYVIHPDYHNRGYMTCALKTAIQELLESGYVCVICGAFEENRASRRVMEKCGMEKSEQTDEIDYRGKTHRCVYYRVTNKEGEGT